MKKKSSLDIGKMFRKLCTPAKVYLVLSFVSVVVYLLSMTSYGSKIKMINGSDTQPHTVAGLVVQVVWVILWTALLNYICHKFKHYGTTISWVLVLLPILFFVVMLLFGMFVLSQVVDNGDVQMKQLKDDTDTEDRLAISQ